ncbi:MAG TPA: TonB-dependent receptor [Vicinamibacterales bacterium]|nr:TonB-dependent receptor [Vicinamibacterales bacterium]
MKWVRMLALAVFTIVVSAPAYAQVQTGSITGIVTDESNAVLPGATVSLSGEKLIGGTQTQTTDATGAYRFDRLPPGNYNMTFELQGFKSLERKDIVVDATFVATVNAKLGVGSVQETVTVTGDSPTVDTRSNLQQTVMNQEKLEGIPSGRDPWSVAKIIPGVQVATYDVGGTQSIQQSSLSAHGSSTNDVSYNIDGASVNWPGGGGGATMLYYDQGMFEEVNYMTSAIPAEVMVGGISINMVTKDAGNKWRGNAKYSYSNGCVTPSQVQPGCMESDNLQPGINAGVLPKTGLLGNPTNLAYDLNFGGGGAIIQDRLWASGSVRRWVINKLVNAKNADGTQAIDDNTLKNYSGKLVDSISSNQKLSFSFNWNNKIRGHRRDSPPDIQSDIASLVQTNPASSTQAKYTGIHNQLVFESSFSLMKGETDYSYQPGTPTNAVRRVSDGTVADFAAARQEEQPNSRTEFNNVVSYSKPGWGGNHLFKGGVQFARLYFDDRYDVLNGMYEIFTGGKAAQVQEFNTPTENLNIDRVIGLFVQDAWTIANKLTLNLGARFDHNVGVLPAQSTPGGLFVGPQSIPDSTPIKQNLGVWRLGMAYDPMGDGLTAVKASYSRYGLQVGIDRVTNVNPFSAASRTCGWTDPNGDGIVQASEIQTATCSAFPGLAVHYAGPNGPAWPYSDEVTAGVERQVMKDMRLGVMYYYRTNRNQIGTSNTLVPASAYTASTVNIPNGPNGPTSATLYNLTSASFLSLSNQILDNQPFLDTKYNGVEFTANKRMSHRWQMVAGLTIGKNTGGLNTSAGSGQATTITGSTNAGDLNDPNQTRFANGIVGNDSPVAFRLSGSYTAPYDIQVAGSLVSNGGYPYVSTYTVTRAAFPSLCTANCGTGLVRSSQLVILGDRGDERLPAVTLVDLRLSRAFRFGQRRISPQFDIYNLFNRYTPQGVGTGAQATSYLVPTSIVAPRIMRIGFSVDF